MCSTNFKLLFILLLQGATSVLPAQETHSLSVDDLFRLGEANSLRLKATHVQQLMAEEREKTARTARLPEMTVGLTGGYIGGVTLFKQGLTEATHPDTPDWSQNYNVQLIQPIYSGGRIENNLRQASLQKQLAALNLITDKADLKLFLLRQYLNLIGYYKQQEVFARNIEESEVRLKDIRRMRKEGVVTRNDEIRSELQLTNDRLNEQEAKNSIIIASQQLTVVLGLDESQIIRPDTAVLFTASSLLSYDEYVAEAYTHYPELQIAQYHKELAQKGVELMKAELLPSLSLRAGNILARPYTSANDVFANTWNVSLNVSYPLSSLYRNRHQMREARQNVFLYQTREEQARQELRIRVNGALIRHREAVNRVAALALSVRQAEENYRMVRNRYLNQLSILTDLLDASNVRLQAELQLTAARTETIYTYYELQRSCGHL
ncbi:MAG: TolC family protein [Bacteroides sp.]